MTDEKTVIHRSCANGCLAEVSPPSKVICRACQDRITTRLEKMAGMIKEAP